VSVIGDAEQTAGQLGRVENDAAAEAQRRVAGHGGLAVLGGRGPDPPVSVSEDMVNFIMDLNWLPEVDPANVMYF
jgi:hypothetical protein